MHTRFKKKWQYLAVAACIWSGGAHAVNSIWLSPADQVIAPGTPATFTAQPGDVLQMGLYMNFDDPTLGGGVDISYDNNIVNFGTFTFDAALPPAFNRNPDDLSGEVNGIAFGDFPNGIGGQHRIGTLTFDGGVGPGSAMLTLAANDAPAGGFFSATTFDAQAVDFYGAQVNVVPELPVAWLMAAGLSALLVRQKMKGRGAG